MQPENRLEDLDSILGSIMLLNQRELLMSYSEDEFEEDTALENEFLNIPVVEISNHIPCAWRNNFFSIRMKAYLSLYLKLFLAYMISSAQHGNFFSKTTLDKIKDIKLDVWNDFPFLDTGTGIGNALNILFVNMFEQKGYFQYECIPLYCMVDEEDDAFSSYDVFFDAVQKSCPGLPINKNTRYDSFEELYFQLESNIENLEEYDLCMQYFQSHLLYDILKREEKQPTRLGKEILEDIDQLDPFLIPNWLTQNLSWSYLDEDSKSYIFAGLSTLDIYYTPYVYDNIECAYPYDYRLIITAYRLISKMEEYQRLYLQEKQIA